MNTPEAVCYGTTKVAQRGQIVIPKEAREAMNLKPGDQLLVFGKDDQILAMIRADKVEMFVNEILNNLPDIKQKAG